MNAIEAAELVSEAQRQIGRMIFVLEKKIGRRISRAELCSFDITTITDMERKTVRGFQIQFEPSESDKY